ncbi:hypothetical protein [Glycomyces rhizosphaerae]|uniref:Uncharacterized protein n=1 Tax=Glycomyces rhizosphaerae TaxID=2054422 RepID=A0ABV7PTM5_9ACTN
MSISPLRAELLLSPELPVKVESQWVEALRGNGFETEVHRPLGHRSPAVFDWVLLLSIPLHAFLSTLGSEAMHDLFQGLRNRARERGGAESKPLVLEDSERELRIVLEPDLPLEAFKRLFEIDLDGFGTGPLHYDHNRRDWRSVSDEAGE